MYTIFLVATWTAKNKFAGYLHPPYSTKEEAEERMNDYNDGHNGMPATVEEYKHAKA